MSEWIKIEDRIPEDFVDVLCWCVNEFGETYEKGEKYFSLDRWCVWTDGRPPSFATDRFYGKVTHWMPLPKPPEES